MWPDVFRNKVKSKAALRQEPTNLRPPGWRQETSVWGMRKVDKEQRTRSNAQEEVSGKECGWEMQLASVATCMRMRAKEQNTVRSASSLTHSLTPLTPLLLTPLPPLLTPPPHPTPPQSLPRRFRLFCAAIHPLNWSLDPSSCSRLSLITWCRNSLV